MIVLKPKSQRCDLVTIQDFGNAIDLVVYDGGTEIARVPIGTLQAIGLARQLLEAGHCHMQRGGK